jgi:hypothetical protein
MCVEQPGASLFQHYMTAEVVKGVAVDLVAQLGGQFDEVDFGCVAVKAKRAKCRIHLEFGRFNASVLDQKPRALQRRSFNPITRRPARSKLEMIGREVRRDDVMWDDGELRIIVIFNPEPELALFDREDDIELLRFVSFR